MNQTYDARSTDVVSGRRLCCAALFVVALLLWAPSSLRSQASPYLGTHFIVAFPDTTTNLRGRLPITLTTRLELVIYSFEGANVSLTGPSGSRSLTVAPDASRTVSMFDFMPPDVSPFVDEAGIPVRRSVEIRSDSPVYLYCRFISPFGSELFTPFPVERWGREYRLAGVRNDPLLQHVGINAAGEEGAEQSDGPAECLVIASENNTVVRLTTTTGTNTPDSFVLDAGESVLVQTERPDNNLDIAPRDLTGTLIEADKPIAVLSGNTRTTGGMSAYRVIAPTTNSARNTLVEWLPPVSAAGQTFVYTPVQPEFEDSEELIRIIGTQPGTTTITSSFAGAPLTVEQGEFVEIKATEWRINDEPTPFMLRTDRPALVCVVTGSWAERVPHNAGEGYGGIRAWSPSMSLLTPVEGWMNLSRFHFFENPASVDQYVLVVAEQSATVTLDGTVLDLAAVPNTAFKWGRVPVTGSGDHTLMSVGGLFSGLQYGIRWGGEAYLPLRIDKGDDDPRSLHTAEYEEDLSISWSAPLAGVLTEQWPEPDSLDISSREFCDSMVVDVRRVFDARDIWMLGPISATLDPGGVNVNAEIVPVAPLGPIIRYRILFTPIDPSRDASGSVTIVGTDVRETLSFSYTGTTVELPEEIDLGIDLTPGTQYNQPLELKNRKSFTATVLSAELVSGSAGFAVDDGGRLPRALLSGQTVGVDVNFVGTAPGTVYRDTLVVFTSCGVDSVPLFAQTEGAPDPEPEPTITGYDWKTRAIDSDNDTVSFIGNDGDLFYRIRRVVIENNPAGAFTLVAPTHANNRMDPQDKLEIGIRFAPRSTGLFVSSLLLITEDDDSVRAELRGLVIDTGSGGRGELIVDDLLLDTVCLGDVLDTFLIVRNPGAGAARVRLAEVVRSTNAGMVLLDPASLPRAVLPGDTVHIPVRITPGAAGPFEVLVGVDSSLGSEGVLLRVTGVAVECEPPMLTVTDHDFGEVWITLQREGGVMLHNVGRGDVEVTAATLVDDTENAFAYLDPAPPFTVREGDSLEVRASFSPMTVGRKDAGILFETRIGNLRANLTGVGKKLVIPAFIRRNYHAMPGEDVTVAVELEMPADSVYPDRIDLTVQFADVLVDPLGFTSDPNILNPMIGPGEVSATLLRSDQDVLTADTLLNVRFLMKLTLAESTELPFTLSCNLPYVDFEERPGLLIRDTLCGLEERLFEFTEFGLSFSGPRPNPASDQAEIDLEIPFDGHTTVLLYDLLGNIVLTAFDQQLVAGRYIIPIPLATVPSGTYILRVRSGLFAFVRRLDVFQ